MLPGLYHLVTTMFILFFAITTFFICVFAKCPLKSLSLPQVISCSKILTHFISLFLSVLSLFNLFFVYSSNCCLPLFILSSFYNFSLSTLSNSAFKLRNKNQMIIDYKSQVKERLLLEV